MITTPNKFLAQVHIVFMFAWIVKDQAAHLNEYSLDISATASS